MIYNLHITGNRDFSLQIDATYADNSAYDFSYSTLKASIKAVPSDTSLADFTVSVENNVVTISLTDDQTADLASSLTNFEAELNLYWDLLESQNGIERTLLEGKVIVKQGVTLK